MPNSTNSTTVNPYHLETGADAAPPPHAATWPAWAPWAAGFGVVLVVVAATYAWRTTAKRAWRAYSSKIGGEFTARNALSPASIVGRIGDRDLIVTTGVSHEDDAPFYHTRACMPLKNPGAFILGLRRKSLLEEAQTRRDLNLIELGDSAFEREFFLICNDHERLPEVLTPETRRELQRYPHVELYVRLGQLEWRRAGEESDSRALERLNALLLRVADTIDTLPSRGRSLTQVLADERLIEKGL